MSIVEVTTDEKTGKRTAKVLTEYENIKPRHKTFAKEQQMKTKTKPQVVKSKITTKPEANGHKPTVARKQYKATIMALNDDNEYSKVNDVEFDEEAQIKAALDRWLKGGGKGQFNVYRRG